MPLSATRSVWSIVAAASLAGVLNGCVVAWPYDMPDVVEPCFDRETGTSLLEDDPIVAVVCTLSQGIDPAYSDIQSELARYIGTSLTINDITVTEPTYIQSWIDQHPDYDEVSEIGRCFECDYVIEVEIAEFSLYEQNSVELLRGSTEAYVTVYEMLPDGSGDRIYETEIDFAYPTRVPSSTCDTPYSQFKMEYLTALSDKITRLFVPDETVYCIKCAT